jgi:UDP-N-acetylenolpyruvoylglucosamine reductase
LYKLIIITERIKELKAATKAATRRKLHKRRRIQKEGTLIVEEGQRLTALKEFRARSNGKKRKKRVRAEGGEPSQQHCRTCREGGHNARTCKNSVELVSE